MSRFHRRAAPRVIHGRVARKNNWAESPSCFNTPRPTPALERWKPGHGYRHVLRLTDLATFLGLLPDWPELSVGLNAVVLAPGRDTALGWYRPGVVAVCAWQRDMDFETDVDWFEEHRDIFERIGVTWRRVEADAVVCRFDEATVRAFQLLHILLHELGHHRDLMTTRSKAECARGEGYAELYARQYMNVIWDRYLSEFELF